MLSLHSACARLCAHGLPSSVLRPWLQSCPASSVAGSSRHYEWLWPLEDECLNGSPGIV